MSNKTELIKIYCEHINETEEIYDDVQLVTESLETFEKIFNIILDLEIYDLDKARIEIAKCIKGYGTEKPYTHYKELSKRITYLKKLKMASIDLKNISCYKPSAFFKDIDKLYKQNMSIIENITKDVITKFKTDDTNKVNTTEKKSLSIANDLAIVSSIPAILPEELNQKEISELTEGAKKSIIINAYERNPKARVECIEHYGTKCFICKFNFAEVYGDIGKGFIHVHHLKPLAEIDDEYEVNPIADLRPVCPNCHAMLHKRKPAYSVEEIQNFIYKKDL